MQRRLANAPPASHPRMRAGSGRLRRRAPHASARPDPPAPSPRDDAARVLKHAVAVACDLGVERGRQRRLRRVDGHRPLAGVRPRLLRALLQVQPLLAQLRERGGREERGGEGSAGAPGALTTRRRAAACWAVPGVTVWGAGPRPGPAGPAALRQHGRTRRARARGPAKALLPAPTCAACSSGASRLISSSRLISRSSSGGLRGLLRAGRGRGRGAAPKGG